MSRVLIKSAWGSDDPTKAAFSLVNEEARRKILIA